MNWFLPMLTFMFVFPQTEEVDMSEALTTFSSTLTDFLQSLKGEVICRFLGVSRSISMKVFSALK